MVNRMRHRLSALSWMVRDTAKRWARAYRYANGTMTTADADEIRYECQDVGGFYPLETLTVDGLVERLTEQYGDHPELREVAHDACARVHDKWNSTGDTQSAAEDWAEDMVVEYAEARGIKLVDSYLDGAYDGEGEA